jgi:carbon storage regulator
MLVLTRKLGEGITIGNGIRVIILGVRGNKVRVGIEAPPQTEIYRDELYARIVEENRKAAGGANAVETTTRLLPALVPRRGRGKP